MRLMRSLLDCLLLAVAAYILTLSVIGCGEQNLVAPGADNSSGDTGSSVPADDPADQVYQFGAKFEPPIGRVVHAQGQWKAYNAKYAGLFNAATQPAAELLFIPIADSLRPWNPAQIAAQIQLMSDGGRIPSMDISLRGNQPTPAELALMENKLFGVDHEIANGIKHDARLQDLVNLVKAYRKPIMIRIGGEFNGSWNGYHPYEYPKAFRKIVNMFRAAGVENAAFVWCYEPAAANDFDVVNADGEAKWYPGADVIDWFSVDLFSKYDVGGASIGHNGQPTPYGKTLRFLDMAVATRKPVVIAESSPSHYDLADASQAAAAWSEWFLPYFALIATRPEIKWFHYINYDWGQASYYASTGWKNNDLTVSAWISAQYIAEVSKPEYLHSGELHLLKDFGKYK